MSEKYYLAYGSNLNVKQMRMRCPCATPIGTAEIPGYELLYKESKTGAYLTIEQKEGCSVPVGLWRVTGPVYRLQFYFIACVPVGVWRVTGPDEARLDRYEGFPSFYYKKTLRLPVLNIWTEQIKTLTCFIYIMHERRHFGIPSLDYIRICAEGYRNFGFGQAVLNEALRRTREEMDKR